MSDGGGWLKNRVVWSKFLKCKLLYDVEIYQLRLHVPIMHAKDLSFLFHGSNILFLLLKYSYNNPSWNIKNCPMCHSLIS